MRIPEVTRTETLAMFADFFREMGAPVDSELGKLGLLNVRAAGDDTAFVPAHRVARFLENMAAREGVSDAAIRCAHRKPLSSIPRMRMAGHPTIFQRLVTFQTTVSVMQSGTRPDIEFDGDVARFCLTRLEAETDAARTHWNWVTAIQLVNNVRQSLQANWAPARMSVHDARAPTWFARESFPDTQIITGQGVTWIEVPLGLLASPVAFWREGDNVVDITDSHEQIMPRVLKGMIRSHLGEEHYSIDRLAELVCSSPRSLQRSLSERGLSFRTLLKEVRHERAVSLLKHGDMPIIEVASSVGYSDPSHFTRAFRSLAGVTPKVYRAACK